MVAFEVKDMSCGGCAATITRAVRSADKSAEVQVDLPRHRVEVRGGTLDAATLAASIAAVGYKPVLADPVVAPAGAPAKASGCCCG